MDKNHAKQFTKLKVQFNEPRAAFDAYVAVWNGPHGEFVIGAPSLDRLSFEWDSITGTQLQKERVQHVVMTLCDVQNARRSLGYESSEGADA